MKTTVALISTGLLVAACAYHAYRHPDRTPPVVRRTVQRVQVATAPMLERAREKTWAFPFHTKRRPLPGGNG